jgi:hypothetical protein
MADHPRPLVLITGVSGGAGARMLKRDPGGWCKANGIKPPPEQAH